MEAAATLVLILWLFGEPLVLNLPAESLGECLEEVEAFKGDSAAFAFCRPGRWEDDLRRYGISQG